MNAGKIKTAFISREMTPLVDPRVKIIPPFWKTL